MEEEGRAGKGEEGIVEGERRGWREEKGMEERGRVTHPDSYLD